MSNRIVFISFLLTLLISLACGINGTTVPATCSMKSLMIDKSLFPEGWGSGVPSERSAPVRWGIEKLGVSFDSQEGGVTIQDVYRGKNIKDTEAGYAELVNSWFDSREWATDWYIPSDFNYESLTADHFRFGCRTYKETGVEGCQFVGQYGIYLTRFHTFMTPIMTYNDLEHILQTIDNKMEQCLGR